MAWEVEYTDEFEAWWDTFTAEEQDSIAAGVLLLQEYGPALGRPRVDTIKTSRHANMKELRSVSGHIRVLFAFDPRHTAILLIGAISATSGRPGIGRWCRLPTNSTTTISPP